MTSLGIELSNIHRGEVDLEKVKGREHATWHTLAPVNDVWSRGLKNLCGERCFGPLRPLRR